MNKQRRKSIDELIAKLEDLKAEVEAIKDEEEEHLENIPENLQSSERYEKVRSDYIKRLNPSENEYFNTFCELVRGKIQALRGILEWIEEQEAFTYHDTNPTERSSE